jgi:hypothetical protein
MSDSVNKVKNWPVTAGTSIKLLAWKVNALLELPITHKIFLDNVSLLFHASQHEYTKPN